MPELERQVNRWLPIGRIESAVFRRVLVDADGHVESTLYVPHGAGDTHVHPVGGFTHHSQSVRFRELNHGVVVFLVGTKSRREFLHGKKVSVLGAGGIVEFLEKLLQFGLIAQRQNNFKLHGL